jgi:hypothetical protein
LITLSAAEIAWFSVPFELLEYIPERLLHQHNLYSPPAAVTVVAEVLPQCTTDPLPDNCVARPELGNREIKLPAAHVCKTRKLSALDREYPRMLSN